MILLIGLSLGIANSPHEGIKDDLGAYYYYSEIDTIVDDVHAEVKAKYTNQIKELINTIRELKADKNVAISNVILNYDKKIAILEQKHDLELQAQKIKGQLNYNKFFWIGFGVGMGSTVGTVFLLESVELPLFTIRF